MEAFEVASPESYYAILGVTRDSSVDEIRRAYHKLAMQWHPDKWGKSPALLGEAKRKFQNIQEAYSVLSDPRKRTLYDAGMYDPSEDDEGFYDFVQEMLSLMSQVKEEEKNCSVADLQRMFQELADGFDSPDWFSSSSIVGDQGCSGKLQQGTVSITQTSSMPGPNFGVFGMSSYCR